MPIYEHACPICEIIFERMRSMSEHDKSAKCPECDTPCPVIPSVANHSFVFPDSQLNGMAPPNTGTSMDWNADRTIGMDADKKWKLIQQRQSYKQRVLQNNPGATGHDLSRTPDGEYKIMKPSERKIVETGRAIGNQLPVNQTKPKKT